MATTKHMLKLVKNSPPNAKILNLGGNGKVSFNKGLYPFVREKLFKGCNNDYSF